MYYNDGKWHGWNGGECPVHPETVVEYVYISEGLPIYDEDAAKYVRWDKGYPHPVIAFRVIKEHREPREFTLYIDNEGSAATWYNGDSMPDLPYCQVVKVREVLE